MQNGKDTSVLEKTKQLMDQQYASASNVFFWALGVQWLMAVAVAYFYSPLTYEGNEAFVNSAMWLAILGGGLAALFPMYLIKVMPTAALTRHMIAVAQLIMSALFIHVSGGRIETHFHIFISFAALSFFGDWKIIITATVVGGVDHVLRGLFIPESIFGLTGNQVPRILEHILWVVVEVGVITYWCLRTQQEKQALAETTVGAERESHAALAATKKAEELAASIEQNAQEREIVAARFEQEMDEGVREISGAMQRFASGDLTVRVGELANDALNEVASVFNTSVSTMERTIAAVRKKVQVNKESVESINADMSGMYDSSHRQAENLRTISSAIGQMSASITESTRSVERTFELASANGEVARAGHSKMQEATDSMQRIDTVVTQSANSIAELGKLSAAIGSISEVIKEIADQTNLLALNAAIEAARAGEQGRGFAVVADEVRKLAERTAKATDEISQTTQTIQTETERSVANISEGKREVDTGTEIVNAVAEVLAEIVGQAGDVEVMLNQVLNSAKEQNLASEEIARSAEMMHEEIESFTQAVETVTANSETVAAVSSELGENVKQFSCA